MILNFWLSINVKYFLIVNVKYFFLIINVKNFLEITVNKQTKNIDVLHKLNQYVSLEFDYQALSHEELLIDLFIKLNCLEEKKMR